jgi:FAD/FMN-containing dehydrogenase
MTQALGDATINELETGLTGSLVRHGDVEYEEARHIWNRAIDKHPAMIVRPASTEDVVRTVRFAASVGLPVAIRGGGHSVAGFSTCDDGIVVDLSAMTIVAVDATCASGRRRRDEVGRVRRRHPGARPGHRRALVSTTGLGGFTWEAASAISFVPTVSRAIICSPPRWCRRRLRGAGQPRR